MGDNSRIEWTDATWNAVTGCTEVSRGCDKCYARTLAHGKLAVPYSKTLPVVDTPENRVDTFAVRLWPERLMQPLRWARPRMIFVNSMSDFFHADVPLGYQDKMFAVMALAHQHTFQVLTKRTGRALRYTTRRYLPGALNDAVRLHNITLPKHLSFPPLIESWPLPNVWLGATVEDQEAAFRVDQLRQCAATVRFLSCEPLLGPLELDLTGIDWLIAGGESGAGFRPVQADWVRSLRDQCLAAGVPFLFKQWGGRTPKAGGRELDKRTWDEFPSLHVTHTQGADT